MHAFCVDTFLASHFEQRQQHLTANLGGAGASCDTEAISVAGNFDIQAALDLSQVLVKLATKIGKAVVIGGLEYDISRNLDSIQYLYLKPLCRNSARQDDGGSAEIARMPGKKSITAIDH
jgi:hypothetical protein